MAALRQTTLALQEALAEAGSVESSIDNASAISRAVECLHSFRPADATQVQAELFAQALNTEQRGLAYLTFSDRLGGQSFPVQDPASWSGSCAFDPSNATLLKSRPVRVHASASVCGGGDTTIFFGNGLLTDFYGAQGNLGSLVSAARDSFPRSDLDRMSFSLSFNPTEGFLSDLWEATKQDLQTDFSRFFRIISGISLMPDSFQEAVKRLAIDSDAGAVVDNAVLARHVNLYKGEIFEGNKVILVAHSQGNFYANQAHVNLTGEEQRSFGIVSVANPDSFVAGDWPYTTLTEDRLMAALREIRPVLPANTARGSGAPAEFLGHSFDLAYLGGSTSRSRILDHVRSARSQLAEPSAGGSDGIVTVTLTWGDQPDVDLHLFEPSGHHVYYLSRQGTSGFLDVDDVNGRGPEHYFVSCDTLQAGSYHIAVNYFNGSAPETAEVQVKAGLLVRTFQVPLAQAVGSAGDQNPIPVAVLVVSGSVEEGFEFQIL